MLKKTVIALICSSVSYCLFAENMTGSCSPTGHRKDIEQAVKWYRDSAEKTALYNQAYGMATQYIDNWVLANHPKAKSWGVVIDVDETALDNSWYYIKCADLADNESDFEHYVTIPEKSIALPGVVPFTNQVHKLGGYVTMLTNRDGSYKDSTGSALNATVDNLKHEGIYFDQVVLANDSKSAHPSDKNPRFRAVVSGKYDANDMVWSNTLPPHKVIAYLGDNIQDFPKFKQVQMDKLAPNNSTYNVFGNGYFIMPNPLYGSWEANQYK